MVPMALASEMIVGHMKPLETELLTHPIQFPCGLKIQEMRGTSLDKDQREKMVGQCNVAKTSFFKFMAYKGIPTQNEKPFEWSLSLLPESNCYRCLNDTAHRFKYRFVQDNVIGYTDKDARYSWVLSDVKDKEFDTTFMHELFHALSMYYGVYDAHPGSLQQKTDADEILAEEFTDGLGYGK